MHHDLQVLISQQLYAGRGVLLEHPPEGVPSAPPDLCVVRGIHGLDPLDVPYYDDEDGDNDGDDTD